MKFKITSVAAVGFGALIGLTEAWPAELLKSGTTYTITGMGFAGTGSPTADFTNTVKLSRKAQTFDHLQIAEHTTFLNAHTEFAEFYIRTRPHRRHARPLPLVALELVADVLPSSDLARFSRARTSRF